MIDKGADISNIGELVCPGAPIEAKNCEKD